MRIMNDSSSLCSFKYRRPSNIICKKCVNTRQTPRLWRWLKPMPMDMAYCVLLMRCQSKCDGFAVARVDEGVRLRKSGIKKRIAVLEGFTCAEELENC